MPKILDGTYFKVKIYLDYPNIKAECMTCGKVCSAALNGTGNLTAHYKKIHPTIIEQLLLYIRKRLDTAGASSPKKTQTTLTFDTHPEKVCKYLLLKSNFEDKIRTFVFFFMQLRELIINFITSNNLAFRIIKTESFKQLLRGISGRSTVLPCIETFNKALTKQFDNIKVAIVNELQGARKVCTSSDVWSSRGQSYMGMSAHIIDETTLNRKSFLLAFRRIKGRCTYDVLGKAMFEVQNEYELKIQKISKCVTDGGSNYCKMFIAYGHNNIEATTIEQTQNDEDDDDISDLEEDETEPDDVIDCSADMDGIAANEIDLEQLRVDFDDESDMIVGDDIVLPKQMRCCSHMLNLVAGKDFHFFLPLNVQKLLNSCLRKLRRVWRLTSKSSLAKTICESTLGRMLVKPNDTRWNSLFDAVNVVLELQDKFNIFCATLNKEIPHLKIKVVAPNSSDWNILSDYATVMRPVANGLDILQGEKQSCAGYILPTLYSMKNHLSSSMLNTSNGEKMRDALLKGIDKRFEKIMELTEENKSLFISSACHPMFKLNWVKEEDCDVVKNWLRCALQNYNQETVNLNTIADVSDRRNSFFIRYTRPITTQQQNNEMERFLESHAEDVQMLHEFPNMKKLFIDSNTTLSSSGPIERMFSHAGLIFQPRRNRLSSSNFEKALFLKINGSVV